MWDGFNRLGGLGGGGGGQEQMYDFDSGNMHTTWDVCHSTKYFLMLMWFSSYHLTFRPCIWLLSSVSVLFHMWINCLSVSILSDWVFKFWRKWSWKFVNFGVKGLFLLSSDSSKCDYKWTVIFCNRGIHVERVLHNLVIVYHDFNANLTVNSTVSVLVVNIRLDYKY